MYPVILSGGSGERLWPLSRALYPKQFLTLNSEKTLFQETLARLDKLNLQAPLVMCNEEHRFIVAENLRSVDIAARGIFLEPAGRNTAPAIAVAAFEALKDTQDAVLLVLPADHIIEEQELFSKKVEEVKNLAQQDYIVTFGITPLSPHTGYGYIEKGKEISLNTYELAGFKEKPDIQTAENFINNGNFLWNSGIFCFKARIYLEELEKKYPDIVDFAQKSLSGAKPDLDFIRLEENSFGKCRNISVDYAIMESTARGAVITLDAGWGDIGSWDALWDLYSKDANNNVLKGDVIAKHTKNSFIHGEGKLISTLGVENLMIIDIKDALLVTHKDYAQNIKEIVADLKANAREEALHSYRVYRPWGHYEIVDTGERDLVKRILVKPGAKLSLQKHFHRSEHWVVVKGRALVTRAEQTMTVSEDESVYLPVGTVHALENLGETTLEIIEVQTGNYLEEDDIVRFNDIYGRT